MIAACQRCTNLYEAGPQGEADARVEPCRRCLAIEKMIGIADALGAWRRSIDIISGSNAADRLADLIDKAEVAANELRAR